MTPDPPSRATRPDQIGWGVLRPRPTNHHRRFQIPMFLFEIPVALSALIVWFHNLATVIPS